MHFLEAAGVVLALFLFDGIAQLSILYFRNKAMPKQEELLLLKYSAKLGRSVEMPDHDLELLKLLRTDLEARYTSSKLSNRLANFCGSVGFGIGWLYALIKYGFLLYGGYLVAAGDFETLSLAGIFLIFSLTGYLIMFAFTALTRLLFGSGPGEPKLRIKALGDIDKRILDLSQSSNSEELKDG